MKEKRRLRHLCALASRTHLQGVHVSFEGGRVFHSLAATFLEAEARGLRRLDRHVRVRGVDTYEQSEARRYAAADRSAVRFSEHPYDRLKATRIVPLYL